MNSVTQHNTPNLNFDEIRIENTNVCAYKCWFCPREKHERIQGFMSVDDFHILIDKLPSDCRKIDLHGYGEPLLDESLPYKVTLAKQKWPDARLRIITTLGIARGAEKVGKLAKAGLNSIEISYYGTDRESYRKIHGVNAYSLASKNIQKLKDRDIDGLDIVVRGLEGSDQSEAKIKEKETISISKGKLHNYGAGREFNISPEGTCSIVEGLRSRILQVTWQLDVIPCCFDYNAEVTFGNLRANQLCEIFSSDAYFNFIDAHVADNIGNISPCNKCEKCFLD